MTGPGVASVGRAGASPRLSAGVITADLTRLGAEMEVIRGRAHWAHVDVMDGAFCPQLTVGPSFVRAVASTGVPVDAHLLVAEPLRFLAPVVDAGAEIVTVHAESGRHPHRALQELTQLSAGVRPVIRGYAINPGTPVQAIEPVLDLIDLVLVLAVNPGWSGQADPFSVTYTSRAPYSSLSRTSTCSSPAARISQSSMVRGTPAGGGTSRAWGTGPPGSSVITAGE